jgi:hypothetical protein
MGNEGIRSGAIDENWRLKGAKWTTDSMRKSTEEAVAELAREEHQEARERPAQSKTVNRDFAVWQILSSIA